MRTTRVRFVVGESGQVPAAALSAVEARFWRREEAVASRMEVESEVERKNRFAMIEGMPVEHEECANIESRAQCGASGRVFVWRDSDRPVCEAAFQLRTPNQSLEPTPPAGTSAAEPPRVPAAVAAHL